MGTYFDDLFTNHSDNVQSFAGTNSLLDTGEPASITKSFTCPSAGIVVVRGTHFTTGSGNGAGNNNLVVKLNGTNVYSGTGSICCFKVSSGDTVQATQGQKGSAKAESVFVSVLGTFIYDTYYFLSEQSIYIHYVLYWF